MKPKSYREQAINGCGNCAYNIDVDGIMVDVCGYGENLTKDSYMDELRTERGKVEADPRRYFDQGEFSNQWLRGRWVHGLDICDEFLLATQD